MPPVRQRAHMLTHFLFSQALAALLGAALPIIDAAHSWLRM
jgi:hypothetical protein